MKWFMLTIAAISIVGFALAEAPTTAPAPETRKLANDTIQFTTAGGWVYSEKNNTDEAAVFVTDDRHGLLQIAVMPAGSDLDDNVAAAIVKKLRAERKKPGIKVIKEAKRQIDKRFDIYIYEEFERDGKPLAQLHLYRRVGKRQVMLTVMVMNADEELKKRLLSEGESTLAEAKYLKK